MTWRLAKSLETLRAEINAVYPDRPKGSDGTIGDQAHASRKSDHNPNAQGVVRAWDKTAFATRAAEDTYCAHIIQLAKGGHPALRDGAYLISNGRIAAAPNWVWRAYTGSNRHDQHTHLSVTTIAGPDGYDAVAGWNIAGHTDPPPEVRPMQGDVIAVSTPSHGGHWVLQRDGGVRCYGDAVFHGSYPGLPAKDRQGTREFLGLDVTARGYDLLADDGSRYSFGT